MSTINTFSDAIDTLPTDQTVPSHSEIQILDTLFKEKKQGFQQILSETKDVLAIGFVFLLFSLPAFDDFVRRVIPATSRSPYILLGIKTALFMFIYFLVKNIYLVRKRD